MKGQRFSIWYPQHCSSARLKMRCAGTLAHVFGHNFAQRTIRLLAARLPLRAARAARLVIILPNINLEVSSPRRVRARRGAPGALVSSAPAQDLELSFSSGRRARAVIPRAPVK